MGVNGSVAIQMRVSCRSGRRIDKFDEVGEEANCTVEDVKDEIFDMVKPADRTVITLRDMEVCKVGDTVVGMLTDRLAFWLFERREQLMFHGVNEESG